MQTIEQRFRDKSEWGPGPWQDEPDKVQWQDETTGMACLIVRGGGGGVLCGYVGVDQLHPDWRRDVFEVDEVVDVHGGLTYAAPCVEDEKEHGICHVPDPGEPDPLFWFGFDTGHAFDYSPATGALLRGLGPLGDPSCYKPLEYVKAEVERLAQQLKARATAGGR